VAGAANFIGFLAVLLVTLELQGFNFLAFLGVPFVVLGFDAFFLGAGGPAKATPAESRPISRNDAFMCSVL
jgi:hypothetical protein